jgi:membrane fusion protein (multidrug efflux system)
MKTIKALIHPIARISFGILLLLVSFSCSEEEEKQKQQNEPSSFPVITIEKTDVTTQKKYPAVVQGVISSNVLAKVSGYVTDVFVNEGDFVQKGQLLFQLETQALNQNAQAAKARVDVAQVEVNRLLPLVEKEIISEVQLQTARANLQDAKSNYQSIQANINYARIVSPVDGVVGSINYRNGALVSAQDAMPLTQVSQIDEVFVYFSMNEKDFIGLMEEADGKTTQEKIEAFPAVEFILSNGKTFNQKGKIEAISGNIDPLTGSLSFRARFENLEGTLRNGASGSIAVPSIYQNKIVVPKVSTFERQNKRFVYVVENDSISEKMINVQDETKSVFVLKNGIEAGTKIMGKGVNRVKDGDKIKSEKASIEDIISSYETVFK